MSPVLTPRETMEAYEDARESVRIYEAAKASARAKTAKTMSARVAEGILWGSTATLIAFVLAFAAQALGIYPV